jgi:hypothetical protein
MVSTEMRPHCGQVSWQVAIIECYIEGAIKEDRLCRDDDLGVKMISSTHLATQEYTTDGLRACVSTSGDAP